MKKIEHLVKQPGRLLTISEDATIVEAAKKMSDNNIGSLVVFDDRNRFTGILTERDMLAKVLTTSHWPHATHVRDIMTDKVVSCTMQTSMAQVEQLMAEHKIRHIPIVENGVPVGMVSSRDTIAYRLHSNKAMKAAAEQLAMLSTGLKSLDFHDVIALAINEVPKAFGADYAVLCFAKKGSSPPIIHRNHCRLPRKNLLQSDKMNHVSKNPEILYGEICDHCKAFGARGPRLLIPLAIQEQYDKNPDKNASRPGFLCMCRLNPSSMGSEELRLYKASLLREVLSANLTNARLYQNYRKARHDSETDPLTGVGTRRMLEHVLRVEYARALRYNHCLSIAIVDLDNFKQINDTAGHAAGDNALKQLAGIMRENVRTTDIIITRYGGDEFVLLMPETKISGAKVLLERLRRQAKTISIPGVRHITISCGLAQWNGWRQDTTEDILKRADAALYEAKRTGRNKVVIEQTPIPHLSYKLIDH